MKVLDPGHRYELAHLDGEGMSVLQFVKREGDKYPGNVGHCEGTTIQEVLRALIHRAAYVNSQISCPETSDSIYHMAQAIYVLERRAARLHGRPDPGLDESVFGVPCRGCMHVGCNGACGR